MPAPRDDRTPEQRFAHQNLAPHPHRLEVRGSPRSLSWPDLCANCGAPARERLRLRKAFFGRSSAHFRRHTYPDLPGYRVVTADVPYCGACAARHRETLPRLSFMRRYATFLFNPAHIATIGFAVLLCLVGPGMLATLIAYTEDRMGRWFFGALVFGVVWTPAIVWWMTRPDRFEPQTEITKALDVSADVAMFYEQRRHIYTFRNQAFAEAFARVNQPRLWTDEDQRRMNRTWLVVAVLFLVGLIAARLALWYYEGR
jgi:hypothetical protein